MEIEYDENFLTDESVAAIAANPPSEAIAVMIADAMEDYDIEVTDSMYPLENEGLLFGAWVVHCILQHPDEPEEEVFDAALDAFAEEYAEEGVGEDTEAQRHKGTETELPPRGTGRQTGRADEFKAGKPRTDAERAKRHGEVEIKTSAKTKLRFETDENFRAGYTKAAKKIYFESKKVKDKSEKPEEKTESDAKLKFETDADYREGYQKLAKKLKFQSE